MRFTGLVKKVGATSKNMPAAQRSAADYAVSPSHSAGAGMRKVAPRTEVVDSNQNDISRFMSTARSRGGNFAGTPTANSRIYQKPDTGAISAFRTPSGGSNGSAKSSHAQVGRKAPDNYNNPLKENKINPKSEHKGGLRGVVNGMKGGKSGRR